MLFYIVDDDDGTRAMLTDIIDDAELGVVIGEAGDGSILDEQQFILNRADILLIDLLMPKKDGIETVKDIKPVFKGKIIMISQMESKEPIARAYSQGVSYFITKPINKIEIISIIKNVISSIHLEKSVHNIHSLTNNILQGSIATHGDSSHEFGYKPSAQYILSELGIVGENGYNDLLDIIDYLFKYENEEVLGDGLPNLKDIFLNSAKTKKREISGQSNLNREIKASEQRIRRAIYHSLTHLASLGINDFMNPTFERYASKFFDFTVVRKRMDEIKGKRLISDSPIRVNTKKFILVLYYEIKQTI